MSATSSPALPAEREDPAAQALQAGLVTFAALHIGLALFMAIAPHAFYTAVGPFGALNEHYIRDTATFYAALGLATAVAVSRPSWRVPVLAITTVQYALHSLNHLLDISKAHPAWVGYADFASLAAATLLLVWLLRVAIARAPSSTRPRSESLPESELR